MRQSRYFIQTMREIPSEAEVISHQLMLRAGMIKKVAAGIYDYLPLGLKVIRKVENIVRENMNKAGAIELLMSVVQPAELWQLSGRWNHFGKELLRFKDRGEREFCLGPTHEEVITDVVKSQVNSYKQMPVTLYQIQTKFRDEVRPRFGLMRGREFIMKDAYSFDIDDAGADISYQKMYDAYRAVFNACGLRHKVVDADTGSIGGSFSHEFMVLADTGEDAIMSCTKCDYSANIEKAVVVDSGEKEQAELKPKEEVATPDKHTAVEVAEFLGVDIKHVPKTMIIRCEGVVEGKEEKTVFVACMVRGDHEVNLAKVKNILKAKSAEFAEHYEVQDMAGCAAGSLGPVNMPLKVYVDNALKYVSNIVVGANKEGFHIKNVNLERDAKIEGYFDIRNAIAGDKCPVCGAEYEETRGIEVGHIFKLGTKYSESMGAKALDKNGKNIPIVMGCYGIGIGRTAASAIEQNYDESGIIWPKAIAPFEVIVVPVNTNDEEVIKKADDIYESLLNMGVDVLIDDRNERAGVKFNDADLIGYPVRVSVGKKALSEGKVEVLIRRTKEVILIDAAGNEAEKIKEILDTKVL